MTTTPVITITQTPTRVVGVSRAVGPTGLKGDAGIDGLDGTNGTNGTAGVDGVDGSSAYELAVAGGFVGTQAAWLVSLAGTDGADGLNGTNGLNGVDGLNGTNGVDGASAYDLAVSGGFVGDLTAWLASLPGTDGLDGTNGTNGTNGTDGPSAYEVAVTNGFVGTEAAWLASLVGAPGADGADGVGVPAGGTVGQVITKTAAEDYATGWGTPAAGAPTAQITVLTAASGDGVVVLARGFTLLAVAYSGAGRLRLYRTASGRTADTARAFTTTYTGEAALLYDYSATAAQTDLERPVDGAWAAGETTIYTRVDSGPVTITLTWIKTAEA